MDLLQLRELLKVLHYCILLYKSIVLAPLITIVILVLYIYIYVPFVVCLVSLDSQPQWRKAVWDPQGKILAYANR